MYRSSMTSASLPRGSARRGRAPPAVGEVSEQPVFGARGDDSVSAWSLDDRFFKPAHAQQLARELPNARLERIENARSFSPEDEPARLAEPIAGFVPGELG
jgi:pimeloyl-ACP methyl ester carboxylesterase